jgi:glycosyltransferase involved in cell wall biosynthesis
MRILMVSEDLPSPTGGGLAKHVLTLCKTFKQQGHYIDLMGSNEHAWPIDHPTSLYAHHFYPELTGQYLGWKEIALGIFNPLKRTYTAKRFAHAIQRRASNYDVIHYHGHYPNLAVFIPSKVNFIQTRHDQGSECLTHIRFKKGTICNSIDASDCAACRALHPNFLQKLISTLAVKRFRHEVRLGFQKHKTLFVSDFLKTKANHCLGNHHSGITLHNFIDQQDIAIAKKTSHYPSLSIPTKHRRFFIAAKLYEAKGVAALLEALLHHPIADIEIIIAGDGEQEQWLRDRYQSPYIHFLGWQSATNTLVYAMQADAMIIPSICEEACPTTVLEGLALGKPVFALARGGTTELRIYENYPKQLQLFTDMTSLAASLAIFQPSSNSAIAQNRYPDVIHAAQSLIALYQHPPGPLSS